MINLSVTRRKINNVKIIKKIELLNMCEYMGWDV